MSDPLVDKQKKPGEHIENRNLVDTPLNFMFSTCSPVFCCLSTRGLEVSLHIWRSWPQAKHKMHAHVGSSGSGT